MSGSLTVTAQRNPFLDGMSPMGLVLDWTATAGGAVSVPIVATYLAQLASLSSNPIAPTKVYGVLKSVETVPGQNGDLATSLPTALYSITILDAYSYDIMAGTLAGRSGTVAEKVLPVGSKVIINSELTLTIANAGVSTKGRIIMEFDAMDVVSAN